MAITGEPQSKIHTHTKIHTTALNTTVLITGFGFFVDSYDFFLYNGMRVVSLTDLGLSGDGLTQTGIVILNLQILGALLGSIVFGIYGDKFGRKRGLIGSILAYSIGMFWSGLAGSVSELAVARFITGLGAAGEVGLGATLVAETVSANKRTFALAFFTLMGTVGVSVAALSLEVAHWRVCCISGGVLGLLLLLFRVKLFESAHFITSEIKLRDRGSLRRLLFVRANLKKFICCTLILVPNYFITGILLTLAPEVAAAAGVATPVKANIALAAYFFLATGGDILGALLSDKLASRKKVAQVFILCNISLGLTLLLLPGLTPHRFYALSALLGLCNLWAISGTIAVEQFDTSLRALASTTCFNFARGMVIVMNLTFLQFKYLGPVAALSCIGLVVAAVGWLATISIRETYGTELER